MKIDFSGGYAGNLTGDCSDDRQAFTGTLLGVSTLSTETTSGVMHAPALVVIDGQTGRVLCVPVAGPDAWAAVIVRNDEDGLISASLLARLAEDPSTDGEYSDFTGEALPDWEARQPEPEPTGQFFWLCGEFYTASGRLSRTWIVQADESPDKPSACGPDCDIDPSGRSPWSHEMAHIPYPFNGMGGYVLGRFDSLAAAQAAEAKYWD
jgi:hypothetical protein